METDPARKGGGAFMDTSRIVSGARRVLTVALFGTLAAGAQAARPMRPAGLQSATPSAAVSGTVIDSLSGAPVGTAVVVLRAPAQPAIPPLRQVTDAKGRFVFPRVAPADGYELGASKPGYFDGFVSQHGPWRSTAPISVRGHDWIGDLHVIIHPVSSLSGTLIDERGRPLTGAHVRVISRVEVGGHPRLVIGNAAITDDQGDYWIGGIPAGNYYVHAPFVQSTIPADVRMPQLLGRITETAVASGWSRGTPDVMFDDATLSALVLGRYLMPPLGGDGRLRAYPGTFHPAGRLLQEAALVTLARGEHRSGVDIQVAPVATVRVSGFVDGVPESHAGLTLRLMAPGTEDLGPGAETATAMVAPDGRFTFLNVPAGEYVLDAPRTLTEYRLGAMRTERPLPETPGFTETRVSMPVRVGPPGATMAIRAERGTGVVIRESLSVGDRDVDGFVVSVRRGATVSGRVVSDTGGTRANVGVMAWPVAGTPLSAASYGPTTPEGAFLVDGLTTGRYVLDVIGGGRVRSVHCAGRDLTYRPVDLFEGQDLSACVIAMTAESATLNGLVREAPGRSAAAAAVLVFPAEPDRWADYGPNPAFIRSVAVDHAGRYTVRGLPAGDYFVVARPVELEDAWQDPAFLAAAAAGATRVHLEWGGVATRDLLLTRR